MLLENCKASSKNSLSRTEGKSEHTSYGLFVHIIQMKIRNIMVLWNEQAMQTGSAQNCLLQGGDNGLGQSCSLAWLSITVRYI